MEASRRGPVGLLAAANSDLFYRFEAEEAKTQTLRIRDQQQSDKITSLSTKLVELTNHFRIEESRSNQRIREIKEALDQLDRTDTQLDATIKLRTKQITSASSAVGDLKMQLAHNFTLLSSDMMQRLHIGGAATRPSSAPAPEARSSSRRRASTAQASRNTAKSTGVRPPSASSQHAARFDPPDLNEDEFTTVFPVVEHMDRHGVKQELPFFSQHTSSKKATQHTSLKAAYVLLDSARRDVLEQKRNCESRYECGDYAVDRHYVEEMASLQERLAVIDDSVAGLLTAHLKSTSSSSASPQKQQQQQQQARANRRRSTQQHQQLDSATMSPQGQGGAPHPPATSVPQDVLAVQRVVPNFQSNVDPTFAKVRARNQRDVRELRYQLAFEEKTTTAEEYEVHCQAQFAQSRGEERLREREEEERAAAKRAKRGSDDAAATFLQRPAVESVAPSHSALSSSDVVHRPRAPAQLNSRYAAAANRQFLSRGIPAAIANPEATPYRFSTHQHLAQAVRVGTHPRRPTRQNHESFNEPLGALMAGEDE